MWTGRLWPGCAEGAVDLPADLAALRVAVLPLVRVDAERDVGLAVPEAALDVDHGEVHRDQHARVAVAEVVQRGLWIAELGGLSCAFKCFAGDLAFEAGAVSAGEHERVRGEPGAAVIDELE